LLNKRAAVACVSRDIESIVREELMAADRLEERGCGEEK
jgi:hypothetical protein